ncbi:3-hydroxyacyl-CoA dehydrogenase [Adlercreutzia sp. R21]|uniref:3-hydroxyacyl-CoA dehydrogenase n=1 Tax=Adlercreutzia wanghongyangiae TaxID=3111451 RepID=UPI002DBFD9E3|nr:3-hydroxyacyl-CoA dehydrogenase [Adlercreutzia sp. R21]MEC4185112.1 3-hydroxyacyl-CoA dehydrogenase [Adlercreutzia sp. R21]
MDIQNITVAGGGVLGSQIALQSAYKGFAVTLWLRSEGSIERTRPKLERLRGIYRQSLTALKTDPKAWCRGLTDSADVPADELDELIARVDAAFEGIVLTTDAAEAFGDADLVIEAIAEVMDEKDAFYTSIKDVLPERTILCTNSSTLLPSAMMDFTGRPEKFLALHFANNIWQNNTAEVMGTAKTGEESYRAVVDFARAIGMIPLELKKEQPGYLLNSMLVPFLNSAEALLANGVADVETIDAAWTLGTGAPLGPFRILDIVGLTTAYNIVAASPAAQDPDSVAARIAALLKARIDEGKTGINAGEGFYSYR